MSAKPPPLPQRRARVEEASPLELTPLRAHYLKRELVTLQFTAELALLYDSPSALALLGKPFLPHSRFLNGLPQPPPLPTELARIQQEREEMESSGDLPFMTFVLNHFILSFPFLVNCPPTFFSHKLQPFVYSFLSRNIDTYAELGDDEAEISNKRKKLAGKVEKHLGLIMSAAIKITENGGKEEVVRIREDGVAETALPASQAAMFSAVPVKGLGVDAIAKTVVGVKPKVVQTFGINVVAVRNVLAKGRVRNKSHEEFIVRTRKTGEEDVYVARRYGDFTKLAETLRKECIEQDVRSPPSKDRRTTEVRLSPPTSPSVPHAETFASTSDPTPSSSTPAQQQHMPSLSRERNRLTLRAYLRTILANPVLAAAPAFQSFLLESAIELNAAEIKDVEIREEMDRIREEEVKSFRVEVEERVEELERYLRGFREELVKNDGLSRVFATIRATPDVADLPIEYKKVLEWARISLASTVYQLFLGSDTSSATFASLKRTHSLMPYFMLRSILRISNPISMIRSILDLFLARPFGSTSLLQKIFSSGLTEEAKELKEQADLVISKIEDERMVEKLRRFVAAPKEAQDLLRAEAASENLDILSVILRSADEPALDRVGLQRVHRASVAYEEYKYYRSELSDIEDDEGPENEDGWLFEDLHVLMRILTKARDKEQLIELIFEGSTSELLKDIVTIFYEPLAKVYKAANIADSLYDLQLFINDLIKTVELAEEANLSDPQRTVQIFVDLVGRHEARFYHFVHQVHSKGEGLFDNLMKWIELFINFIRSGLPSPVSLDFLLPASGPERAAVLAEVDSIIEYHRAIKAAHHERMRRRLIRGESKEEQEEKNGDAAFVGGVMESLQMGAVLGDVEEVDNEDSEDEQRSEDDSSEDEGTFEDAESDLPPSIHTSGRSASPSTSSLASNSNSNNPKPLPAIPGHLVPIVSKKAKSRKKDRVPILLPALTHIPNLVPIFVELVRDELDQARLVQGLRLADV